MAKSKANEWLTEDKLTLLTAWARDGLTNLQIATNIGIVESTLYEWLNKHKEISESLKKGKEVTDIEVENALFKKAIGYRYDEVTHERIYFKTKDEYEVVETKRVTKEVQGDITAQIYWLKNRKPDKWRDKRVDEENEEQINNAKNILFKIRKMANDGTTN